MLNHPLIQFIAVVAALGGLWLLASSLNILSSLSSDVRKELSESFLRHPYYIMSGVVLIAIAIIIQIIYRPASRIVPFAVGLIVTLCVGSLVKHIKAEAERDTEKITCPRNANAQLWDNFVTNFKSPGLWIGYLERPLFYIILWMEKPELIVAVLAFKIAAKWEAWKNIVKIPEKINGADELEFAIARRTLGAQKYSGLFIGTIGNILAALAGYGVMNLLKT